MRERPLLVYIALLKHLQESYVELLHDANMSKR